MSGATPNGTVGQNPVVPGWYTLIDGSAQKNMVTGWWFQPTPLKNDGAKVSWDDDIPTKYGKS